MDAQSVKALVDAKFDKAAQLARDIWNYAELPYEEEKSAAALIAALEQEGFSVEKGGADMPTAFVATFQNGEGGLTIGLLGEYDALSSLSQKAACTVKTPVCEGAPGHGCGHNLLGAGALAAAVAVKDALVSANKPGKVVYFGCPAEEGARSKPFMARAGCFDGVDFCITWHPSTVNEVLTHGSLAIKLCIRDRIWRQHESARVDSGALRGRRPRSEIPHRPAAPQGGHQCAGPRPCAGRSRRAADGRQRPVA